LAKAAAALSPRLKAGACGSFSGQTKLTILNQSEGKWAVDSLAQTLARSLWVDVSDTPGKLNYVLCADAELIGDPIESFIQIQSIRIAADKLDILPLLKSA
jgi:hypothetical protein